MSLVGVISSFSTGTYIITRTAADMYINGIRTPGATSTFTLDASIQPVTGRALYVLPVARHTQDVRKFWTTTQLITLPNPDKITIDGELFEVFQVFVHSVLSDAPFYRVYCARQTIP